MTVGFEQAAIKIVKEQEFAQLQSAVEQAFLPGKVEQFLKRLDRKGVRIRDFERVLTVQALEVAGGTDLRVTELYRALPLSDQAQMREFYLSKIEAVDVTLRHKFKKLYQNY